MNTNFGVFFVEKFTKYSSSGTFCSVILHFWYCLLIIAYGTFNHLLSIYYS